MSSFIARATSIVAVSQESARKEVVTKLIDHLASIAKGKFTPSQVSNFLFGGGNPSDPSLNKLGTIFEGLKIDFDYDTGADRLARRIGLPVATVNKAFEEE